VDREPEGRPAQRGGGRGGQGGGQHCAGRRRPCEHGVWQGQRAAAVYGWQTEDQGQHGAGHEARPAVQGQPPRHCGHIGGGVPVGRGVPADQGWHEGRPLHRQEAGRRVPV